MKLIFWLVGAGGSVFGTKSFSICEKSPDLYFYFSQNTASEL